MKKSEIRSMIKEEMKKSEIKKMIQQDLGKIKGVRYVEKWLDGAIVALHGKDNNIRKKLKSKLEKIGYSVSSIGIGFDYNSNEQQLYIKKNI